MSVGWLEGDLNRVLKAIDKLRNRKSRPNLPGLSRYLHKTHKFSSDKTLHLLDILLARDKVREVVYKGNISYRNMLNWRQPTKPNYKTLQSTVNSSIVISTMKRLLENQSEDPSCVGVDEASLQAALIEQLDGAAQLEQIRKQIQNQVDRKTIVRNKYNRYVLGSNFRDTEDESDNSVANEPEQDQVQSEESEADYSQNTARKNAIKNLELSIDNVVQNIQLLSDDDVTEHVGVKKRRKIWQVCKRDPNEDQDKKSSVIPISPSSPPIKKRKRRARRRSTFTDNSDNSQLLEESVKQDSSVPEQPVQNKNKRIIRKKTIYDPSEFELTPLVRKKKRNTGLPTPASTSESSLPLVGNGGRGRVVRKRGGNSRWISERQRSPYSDSNENTSNSSVSTSPVSTPNIQAKKCQSNIPLDNNIKDKKQVGSTNKRCCICSRSAEKGFSQTLSCSLCLNIAHSYCYDIDDLVYKGSRKWRCEDCNLYNPVLCSLCQLDCTQLDKNTLMLMCDYCEEFFHGNCHYPPVSLSDVQSDTIWRCSQCPPLQTERVKVKVEMLDEDEDVKDVDMSNDIENLSMLSDNNRQIVPSDDFTVKPSSPLPLSSAEPFLQEIKTEEDDGCVIKKLCNCPESASITLHIKCDSERHRPDESIPTVADWTTEQLSQYFCEKFGQDVANAFKSQDIDGKEFLNLSREFVTDNLGLEFGVALKLLYYVRKIQLQTNILHELWPQPNTQQSLTSH